MFAINDDMFGLYARIQTGFSREPHIYKIIARIESNGYCDLPLCTCDTKQTRHEEIVPVLLVIHCGIDESEVIRVKEGDCEIVKSRLSELAEADRDGRCVVLPCKVGDTVYVTIRGYIEETKVRTLFFGHPSYSGGAPDPHYYRIRCENLDLGWDAVGKTVFLTRPEAEAAMKGGLK